MNDLYKTKLAAIYDHMYQGFIDYPEEYSFYAAICSKFNSNKILEIACGSGNLAKSFSENFDYYTGIDLSKAMLSLARKKYPPGNFIEGDMRNFYLYSDYDAILITGRSTSYLISDQDILSTFTSVYKNLNEKGIFIFDFIDAEKFMPFIQKNKEIVHTSSVNGKHYFRKSIWEKKKSSDKHIVLWNADYYSINNHNEKFLGNDTSTFRCFNMQELRKLLSKVGFKMIESINRKTYAFDTYVLVCRKE